MTTEMEPSAQDIKPVVGKEKPLAQNFLSLELEVQMPPVQPMHLHMLCKGRHGIPHGPFVWHAQVVPAISSQSLRILGSDSSHMSHVSNALDLPGLTFLEKAIS